MTCRSGGAAAASIARRLLAGLATTATTAKTTPTTTPLVLLASTSSSVARPAAAALCGPMMFGTLTRGLGACAAAQAAAASIGRSGGGGAAAGARRRAARATATTGALAAAGPRAFFASSSASFSSAARGSADPSKTRKGAISDTGMYLGAVIVGMVGVSYASVPLYRAFCQATGYGGAVGPAKNVEAKVAARGAALSTGDPRALDRERRAAQRELRVWLEADVDENLPWKFTPATPSVTVRPGQSALAFFTAENTSDEAITGVSTYNVVPDRAAFYFNKIQCFCFEQQRLRGKEKVDMPVLFYIDPELVDDFNCRNVHDVTLAYTFYRVEDEEGGNDDEGGGLRLHGPDGERLAPGAAAAAVREMVERQREQEEERERRREQKQEEER